MKLRNIVILKILNIILFFVCFQGISVTQNVSWGIIISTRSLVLQRVARIHAGFYACAAANDRGETQSSLVNLRIRCKCFSIIIIVKSTICSQTHFTFYE